MKVQYIHFSLIDHTFTKPYQQFSERQFYKQIRESWVDEFGDDGGTEFIFCVHTPRNEAGLIADIACTELHFMMDGINPVIHDINGPSVFNSFNQTGHVMFCLYGKHYSIKDFCNCSPIPDKQKALLKIKYNV